MAMIAVAGLDMAAWDALARAAGVPLCVLLGGSVGAVPAYNSNGLGLKSPEEVASEAVELREEGGFQGLKLRLGRDRLADDLATIDAVREALGTEMKLMVDFNQGLQFGEALERCHAIDDLGLAWIEEPIVYDNLEGYARLTADLKTPVHIGENFYGPRALYTALQMKACDYVMPDFMRIGGVTGWQRVHCELGDQDYSSWRDRRRWRRGIALARRFRRAQFSGYGETVLMTKLPYSPGLISKTAQLRFEFTRPPGRSLGAMS
jgi:mandelate racemase